MLYQCIENMLFHACFSTLKYKNRIVRVPIGHLWIEGDNHNVSKDSNIYGPVSTYSELNTFQSTHSTYGIYMDKI